MLIDFVQIFFTTAICKRELLKTFSLHCRQVRLSPAAVNAEVELLQSFAGSDAGTPLRDITFTSRKSVFES